MEAAAQQAKDQAELNELVVWASARGLLADAEELVARGADLTTRDKQGRRPVHYAAAHGHVAMLQYLSRKGADLEAEDPQARLPLHFAAASAKGVEALRYLIQHTTWVSAPDAQDDTPLHLAARKGWVDGVKLLLGAGAEVDQANKRGLSALGEAVAGGHLEAAEALLAAGADPGWRAAGYTLLHVAAGLGQSGTLKLLFKHLGDTTDIANDCSNDDGATPLHAAAMAGSTAAVQLLLAHGADPSATGADGTLAWQLVPTADTTTSSAAKHAASEKQQQLEELQQLLKDKAAKGGKWRSSKASARAKVDPGDKGGAAAAAQSPVEAYSEQFKQLGAAEQNRKVEGFAKLSPAELREVGYLSDAAKATIAQVRRAHQLLAVYRAVAALRADEEFQEDASDPEVQAALQDMGLHNNMEKYAGRRQVVAVATKLKKFHTVMQECGGIKLGLQDLLVPAGHTPAELTAKDAAQVQQLTTAAAAARADVVAAITGQLPADIAGGRRSVGRPQGVSSSGAREIEPVAEQEPQHTNLADAADNELDRELLQHRQAQSAALVSASSSALVRVRKFLNPSREELEAMPFGRRMQFEVVNSFLQAVKILFMMGALMGVMWYLGALPTQQDPQLLEARLQQHLAGTQQAAGQEQLVQQAGGEQGHEEL